MAARNALSVEETTSLQVQALTKLTPRIVPVLRGEINSTITKCYGESLIGEDMYQRGTTLGHPSEAAQQLLAMIQAQVRTKPGAYYTFLKILRENGALEHIADMIEAEVAQLKLQKSKNDKKSCKTDTTKEADLDKGYLSDECPSSEVVQSDAVLTASAHEETGYLGGEQTDQDIPTSGEPLPFAGFTGETSHPEEESGESGEENRSLQESEIIGQPVTVTDDQSSAAACLPNYHHEQSNSCNGVPVYRVNELDSIHILVNNAKKKVERLTVERDHLQQKLDAVEREKSEETRKLEEELLKTEDLKQDIEKKDREIDQYKQTITNMKKEHDIKIKELEQKHEMESKKGRQQIQQLEEELQEAESQNNSLMEEKTKLEEEIEDLKQTHMEEIEKEKEKYKTKVEEYKKKIDELNEGRKAKENEFMLKEDLLKTRQEVERMKIENKHKDEVAILKQKLHDIEKEKASWESQLAIKEERLKCEQEKMESQLAIKEERLKCEQEKMEAQNKIHRAQSETQQARSETKLAQSEAQQARNDAQQARMEKDQQAKAFEQERRQLALVAQRSISSSSSGSSQSQGVLVEHFSRILSISSQNSDSARFYIGTNGQDQESVNGTSSQ